MATYVKQGNIFGRIGTGLGKGLAEQLPQEIERGRLRAGLENLSQQEGLSPFQQFAGLASVPGVTPQMIQSGAELLRQQGIAQGFKNVRDQGQPLTQVAPTSPLRRAAQNAVEPQPSSQVGLQPQSKGFVNPEATQQTLRPYIPRTFAQNQARAADLQEQYPELYPLAQDAMNAAIQEDASNQARSNAQQAARQSQIGVEDRVRKGLQDLRGAAGVQIPDNVYQQVENDMIDKIGKGMGETEAQKEGQKELDRISRRYKGLDTIGNWTMQGQSPKSVKRAVESLRQDFKKDKDLENFADSLVGVNGLSYPKAYQQAYPIEDYKEVNDYVKSLPELKTGFEYSKGYPSQIEGNDRRTLDVAKEIAPLIKSSDASPLSVAQELALKNYDPDIILDYLVKNKNKLNLSLRQNRELDKPRNWFPSLNDLWFFLGSGQDRLVE